MATIYEMVKEKIDRSRVLSGEQYYISKFIESLEGSTFDKEGYDLLNVTKEWISYSHDLMYEQLLLCYTDLDFDIDGETEGQKVETANWVFIELENMAQTKWWDTFCKVDYLYCVKK